MIIIIVMPRRHYTGRTKVESVLNQNSKHSTTVAAAYRAKESKTLLKTIF